ncbi:hypothetical protein CISG_06186 [Coccidioides immitis RMSCC 3703]|uniref:Secreted protein n=1 Tax=Coccidioides immitis RMSCC 3703 TaxID=454286 RepID=A0A0J8QWA9_COCIT|nr:hypothetical protein CISG_06186 [Coccidioides immitis RMSCC 3703]
MRCPLIVPFLLQSLASFSSPLYWIRSNSLTSDSSLSRYIVALTTCWSGLGYIYSKDAGLAKQHSDTFTFRQ